MPQTKPAMDAARLCSKTKCSSNGWCVKEDVCQCYAGFSGAGCSLDLGTTGTVGDVSVSLKSDDRRRSVLHIGDLWTKSVQLKTDEQTTAAAVRSSQVPFEATFSNLETIGTSNYTHFWMPTPLTRVSAAPDAPLRIIVDLCGDGSACPPPGHPQPEEAYFMEPSSGGPWTPATVSLMTNAVIRLNQTVSRGFGGGFTLNTSTNTTAMAEYQDWSFDSVSGEIHKGQVQKAPITGLPPILDIRYMMDTPSAILNNADGGQVALAQFYGYLADAPKLGGCHGDCSRTVGCVKMCFSTITIASLDAGESWEFRSAIKWDSKLMPSDSEGPCEPSLATMPDGKTLLSVFRLNSDANLWQATSSDQGR